MNDPRNPELEVDSISRNFADLLYLLLSAFILSTLSSLSSLSLISWVTKSFSFSFVGSNQPYLSHDLCDLVLTCKSIFRPEIDLLIYRSSSIQESNRSNTAPKVHGCSTASMAPLSGWSRVLLPYWRATAGLVPGYSLRISINISVYSGKQTGGDSEIFGLQFFRLLYLAASPSCRDIRLVVSSQYWKAMR
jgi:hypothetical protein